MTVNRRVTGSSLLIDSHRPVAGLSNLLVKNEEEAAFKLQGDSLLSVNAPITTLWAVNLKDDTSFTLHLHLLSPPITHPVLQDTRRCAPVRYTSQTSGGDRLRRQELMHFWMKER
ncbi:hypothetical protein PsYK624_138610 [Phanerochaete sordida]|uniref:Uncharacterized protein n=1 Tax=Phanerochaete sordida TaxID=48140 RepID=A0A9P3GLQ3_9APHY|nr:hypothetical protein PsYK624_138610 [Phanerochaete sordida]